MIESARSLDDGSVLNCDVAIVGAGAAGLTLALGLMEKAPHLEILIVEAGGRKFDFKAQTAYFGQEKLAPDAHPSLDLYRRRMLGGTTSIWGGRCIRLSPDDFSPRPEIGRIGWPIAYRDVASYYPKALEILEGGAPEFNAEETWADASAAFSKAATGDLIADEIERFSPPTDLGKRYAEGLAGSGRLRILLDAPCIALLTNENGTVANGALLRSGEKSLTVKASATVIAAGGLETPRLLLSSRHARSQGLGNDHDQVGRYYMTHLAATLGMARFNKSSHLRDLDYAKSHDGVWCRRIFGLSDNARGKHRLPNFVMRPTVPSVWDPSHGNAILSAVFFAKRFLVPEYARRLSAAPAGHGLSAQGDASSLVAHFGNLLRGAPSLFRFTAFWARNRWFAARQIPSLFLESAEAAYPLEINMEQLPDPLSRVSLGDTLDPLGMPRLIVNWKPGGDFAAHVVGIYDAFGEAFAAAGLGTVILPEEQREKIAMACEAQGGHHIGTARMSAKPQDGVVDRNCEVWGTKGLFVAGSAVFPTSGFANPTLTISALALRLADHLAETCGGKTTA